jgi:tetratricopeptide (TPR) repeat protein
MTTTRLLILVLVAIILLTFASVAHAAEPAELRATQSVAIIFSRSIDGSSCGNGFFLGDGSLVVTAGNVVFPQRFAGFHQGDAFVTVLSPHRGEAAEAQVVAQDRGLDLVLLRVPWRGHPALQLAEEADLVAAEKLEVVAFTNEQSAVGTGNPTLLASPPQARCAVLDINAVMVRQNATRTIVTMSPPAGPGWAGAPMLLPGTDSVAGCYVRTQADGSAGAGVACGQIRRLIESAGESAALHPTNEEAKALADVDDAILAYLRGVSASAAGEPTVALGHFEQYLKLRPTSAIGYRDVAGQLQALGRMQESQLRYQRALELDPSLVSARVLYGQLLHERILPRAAEEQLRYAWIHGGSSATATIVPMCNLLREQGRDAECLPLLDEALKRRPSDAHLWNYLGQTRRALADNAGAAAAFARSADLMPDDPAPRLSAAEQFESAGQRARAEDQYRTLVAQHPDAATAHFHLARFLACDSGRQNEAIATAEQALKLADTPGAPPRSVIQSLIAAIRAGRTSPTSQFRL